MVNAVHEREEASVTQRREARPPNTSIRILIAEDNLVNQRLAMRQLQKLGYTADPVGNGFAVLEELKRNVYDVILMDCQMPELDGYEVTRRIRAWEAETRRPPVYIIAVTAHALEGDRERCVNAGMNDYITKPVHMAQLEAALNRALKPRAGAAAAAGATVLDPVCLAGLKELREPGQPDPLTELFDLFRRESARCVASLSEGSGAHNAQAAAQAAHTLKGSASNLGATQLATLCAQAEQRARVADWDRVDQLIHQVEQELERVKTALAAEI
jgi:CheY-like chemotaxis protein